MAVWAARLPRPRISDEDWEDIAIEEGFLLSALELHSELLEAGKELSRRKTFFKPWKFRPSLADTTVWR